MAVYVESNKPFKLDFPRTVRNVGVTNTTYEAEITSTSQVKAAVEPSILSFISLGEKKSFVLTVVEEAVPENFMSSSSLLWSDGTRNVRSPIVVIHVHFSTSQQNAPDHCLFTCHYVLCHPSRMQVEFRTSLLSLDNKHLINQYYMQRWSVIIFHHNEEKKLWSD